MKEKKLCLFVFFLFRVGVVVVEFVKQKKKKKIEEKNYVNKYL